MLHVFHVAIVPRRFISVHVCLCHVKTCNCMSIYSIIIKDNYESNMDPLLCWLRGPMPGPLQASAHYGTSIDVLAPQEPGPDHMS